MNEGMYVYKIAHSVWVRAWIFMYVHDVGGSRGRLATESESVMADGQSTPPSPAGDSAKEP
jgi:hypothetical protein